MRGHDNGILKRVAQLVLQYEHIILSSTGCHRVVKCIFKDNQPCVTLEADLIDKKDNQPYVTLEADNLIFQKDNQPCVTWEADDLIVEKDNAPNSDIVSHSEPCFN